MVRFSVSFFLSVCRVHRPNSRTERPRELHIGRLEAHNRSYREQIQKSKGQRSRSPRQLILSSKVCHIFRTRRHTKFKLGTQWSTKTRITDNRYDLQGQRRKVTWSRGVSDRCSPISRERKVSQTQKMVGRLFYPRAITCTSPVSRSKVKGQGCQAD